MNPKTIRKQVIKLLDDLKKQDEEIEELIPKTHGVYTNSTGSYIEKEHYILISQLTNKQILIRTTMINKILDILLKIVKEAKSK